LVPESEAAFGDVSDAVNADRRRVRQEEPAEKEKNFFCIIKNALAYWYPIGWALLGSIQRLFQSLITCITQELNCQWKRISRKQSARWQHVSRLKASAFCIWKNILWWFKTQQLILGTGTAIWWVTEPHSTLVCYL
jgi:hypothetical protein